MTIRWALVGPGRHAARSVVPQMKKAAGTGLAAVVSRDPARGAAFAEAHGIAKVHTSLDAALRDPGIDAIYDATPDALHAPHAIAAANAGKHALIEKPLAMSVRECADAIAAARQHGVKLGVVFNQRHEAVHQEARRIVLAGEIGEVKLVHVQIALRTASTPSATNWRSDPNMRAGGIVISIGDHAHDTLAYLVGQEVEEVSALTDAARPDARNERVAGLLLKLSKGAIGYAAASYATPFAKRPFEIHGTKGTLVIENSFTYLTGAGEDPTPILTLVTEAGTAIRRFAATRLLPSRDRAVQSRDRGQGRADDPAR